jgi:hypothetical protein
MVFSSGPLGLQKREIGGEFTTTIAPRLGKVLSSSVFHGRLFMNAELTRNGSTTPALRIQLMDLSEERPTPLLPSYSYLLGLEKGHRLSEVFWLHGLARLMLLFPRESTFEVSMMPRQHLLQGFTQMMDEMPAIGNLKSLWGTSGCSTGLGRATITADDCNGRF